MMRAALSLAVAAGLAGCAASPYSRAGGGVGPLQVSAVDWNPARAAIDDVRAVADSGSDVVAFADGAATVLSGGRVVAVDRSVPRWAAAGTLPAPDGSGTWIVGVDGDGGVRRLLGRSRMEPVSDRFGLAGERVLSVAALGGASAAFLLPGKVAVADGAGVTRYGTGPLATFAGGGGHVALGGDPLRVFDVAARGVSTFDVPGYEVSAAPWRGGLVAVTPRGRLVVATDDAIWAEDDRGDLRIRFEARGMTLHGLAAAGDRVWFADGAELGVIEGGQVRETHGAKVSPAATLTGSPSGDVWTITGGALARYTVGGEGGTVWEEAVEPVFHRVCERCHRADGSSGVSLATKDAWEKRRARIRERVLVRGDMPPYGVAMSAADRDAIRRWAGD